jgi:hypothetical protein
MSKSKSKTRSKSRVKEVAEKIKDKVGFGKKVLNFLSADGPQVFPN